MLSVCFFVYKRRVIYFFKVDILDALVVRSVLPIASTLDSVVNLEDLLAKVYELTLESSDSLYSVVSVQLVLLRNVAEE